MHTNAKLSEDTMIGCSTKCYDPKSTKWWKSEFYNKVENDSDLDFHGLYCKFFTFTNGQCSTCLRSTRFGPSVVTVPTSPYFIGINVGKRSLKFDQVRS